jgi:hypothetical protein
MTHGHLQSSRRAARSILLTYIFHARPTAVFRWCMAGAGRVSVPTPSRRSKCRRRRPIMADRPGPLNSPTLSVEGVITCHSAGHGAAYHAVAQTACASVRGTSNFGLRITRSLCRVLFAAVNYCVRRPRPAFKVFCNSSRSMLTCARHCRSTAGKADGGIRSSVAAICDRASR